MGMEQFPPVNRTALPPGGQATQEEAARAEGARSGLDVSIYIEWGIDSAGQ